MKNFTANYSSNPTPPPRLDAATFAQINTPVLPVPTVTPADVVAVSTNWDTDFRKKIGIERWGWGLND